MPYGLFPFRINLKLGILDTAVTATSAHSRAATYTGQIKIGKAIPVTGPEGT
jgi:hypothetical protein